MNISLCIPNYERIEILIDSFIKVLNDDRISEIVIMDDNSSNYANIKLALDGLSNNKIKLYKQDINLGTFFNKLECVKKAENEYIILLDSDNIIDVTYIDKIYQTDWSKNKLISPERLIHHEHNMWNEKGIFIKYTKFNGVRIDKAFCKKHFLDGGDLLDVLLNTGNFFVNKESYIKSFDINTFNRDVDICDVGFFNYLFLSSNETNYIEVCPDLEYTHRVHQGSYYMNNSSKSGNQINILKNIFTQ
jgi:hypothetical protein